MHNDKQHPADAEIEGLAAESEEAAVEDAHGELLVRIAELEEESAQRLDQLLRARAEMENLHRRMQRDVENAHKFALEKFAADLLAVRDSLEMGVQAAREATDVESIREGTELTLKMLSQTMSQYGVEALDPMGERFDPDRHQAMSMQESGEYEPNTVMAVMQKGYLLNERLLRPAMVMVAKAPSGA
ncbi:molecular chaperone GrpE [Ectothiorhodosinus mongolicus]|uniref:Protein GrpE n=1 Tax=Ectothiorhodosinus mongolicus TaxID=233100 RepID=A0A1R3VNS0_9GAMM|nr:nucleotide exchange factor GrpE [Ectothiorhodosinus mongolicus]ULX56545.1 nucleotide exchange factor GrpE [Ectothiorhodosinus mongolicus]SIT66277.1 molecular chaperone GrpE [Ectothiorhodosinus mongolicus]